MPTKIDNHRPMVRGKHAVDGIPSDSDRLDIHQLIFVTGPEEDMVDAPVDQFGSRLERR